MSFVIDFIGFEIDGFDIENADLFSKFIIENANNNQFKKKKGLSNKQVSYTKMSQSIKWDFYIYIYIVCYKRLFALALYNDIIYTKLEETT